MKRAKKSAPDSAKLAAMSNLELARAISAAAQGSMKQWPRTCLVVFEGTRYVIPADCLPAIERIPEEHRQPILAALARDMAATMKGRVKANALTAKRRSRYMDKAMELRHVRGLTNASIGAHLAAQVFGNADRIARAVAAVKEASPEAKELMRRFYRKPR